MERFTSTFSWKLIYVFSIDDDKHKGLLKVGEATVKPENEEEKKALNRPSSNVLNKAAKKRIDSYTRTAGIRYDLRYTELAEKSVERLGSVELEYFSDHDVHSVLTASGIKRVPLSGSQEWFKTDLDTVKNAIKAVKEGRPSLTGSEISNEELPIVFRPEQEEAIKKTLNRFKKSNKMLLNAKMRFGKTLCTLEIARRMKAQKTIIFTHRPVVDAGWHEDFKKVFKDDKDYLYLDKSTEDSVLEERLKSNKPFIFFASIQDLRGSEAVGGKFSKNSAVFNTIWDLVIIDEAHEGTKTDLGNDVVQKVIKQEEKHTKVIYLSGTPFNLIDEFEEEDTYTWDYVMEQKAKEEWDITHALDSNPYESLPRMNIYTYDIAKAIPNYEDIEDNCFNFNEFFRVWSGKVKDDGSVIDSSLVGHFVHEKDVKRFLNMLCTKDDSNNYPFSRDDYREYFRHTLWMLPGVASAKAMEKLLSEHLVFGTEFKIINVAGETEDEIKDPLERVNTAISNHPEETRTITLSCGRLTTGVSIKAWTAVLMLSGSAHTSASLYLQTIFRVQTPANINGRMKDECFVFDFAPDRTLEMVAEAGKLASRPGSEDASSEERMKEFLNFCPVIAIRGSEMHTYDVNAMLRQLKRYYASQVVKNGFDSPKLYNDKLLRLTDLDNTKFEELKKTVGATKAVPVDNKIILSESGLGPEEQKVVEEAEKKKREKKELTQEEKDALEKLKKAKEGRAKAISILRAISIRIPLLIYGANCDFDEQITIDKFTIYVEDKSWEEFMPKGVTKAKFKEFIEYYDKDIFIEAGNQIRRKAKAADELLPTERVMRIAEIFSSFKNPDKETVLTPWRVVNKHLGDTLGGYNFYSEKDELLDEDKIRFIEQDEITKETLSNTNAKILEINSKSGLYPLYVTYSIFRERLKAIPEEEQTRGKQLELWDKTVRENIFIICKTEMSKTITQRTLMGYREGKINSHAFDDLINQFENKSDQVVKTILNKNKWKVEGEGDMKFDAVVGNPPYQKMDGGAQASATPVYNFFVDVAIQIGARYISMIMPSRWMTGGKGLDAFRNRMIHDRHIIKLYDYINGKEIFSNVDIKGGVCYFLRDNKKNEQCEVHSFSTEGEKVSRRNLAEEDDDIYIRDDVLISIKEKTSGADIMKMSTIVSARKPYGLEAETMVKASKYGLPDFSCSPISGGYKVLGLGEKQKRTWKYLPIDYPIPKISPCFEKYKVFIAEAYGCGAIGEVPSTPVLSIPVLSIPGELCTETFLEIGPFETKIEAGNVIKYIATKFFRCLVGIQKQTQHTTSKVYRFVPIQDFTPSSDIDWTQSVSDIDKQLYKKYGLSDEEIKFIEAKVQEMK